MGYIGKRTKAEFLEGNAQLSKYWLDYIVARCESFTNVEGALFMVEAAYDNVADVDDNDAVVTNMDCIIDSLVSDFGFVIKS